MKSDRARDSVLCPVAQTGLTDPDRAAIRSAGKTLTYGEFDELVSGLVLRLNDHGVRSGDRVALLVDGDWPIPPLLWALFRIGAVAVLLDSREPHQRLRKQCEIAGCKICVANSSMELCESEYDWRWIFADPATHDYAAAPVELDLAKPATIVFTSGSSGVSKGVLHTLGNHWYSARGSQKVIPVDSDVRWLAALPFFHVSGLSILFRCFQNGGCVVITGKDGIAGALSRFGVTHISLVPTQLHRLLESGESESLARLRCVLVGGANAPANVLETALAQNVAVVTTYGLTEMASQVATAGQVLPFGEVRLSTDGEILVRGATRFAGYVAEEGLDRPFDDDGWFATGDLGRLDANGHLTVLGRKDGVFISGGENVIPEEIEQAILDTGLVDRVVVVAVRDSEFGARPVAFVSPLPNEDQLRNALRGRIAGFKIPDRFLTFPESRAGLKHRRAELADLASRQ